MDHDSPINRVDALYDFLYIDRHRIDAYVAQFDDLGILAQTKSVKTASETGGSTGSVGIPQVAQGALSVGKSTTETIERQYNPKFTVPLALIDHLENQGMIRRDLSSAPIASLVLVEGSLEIADIRMMKSLWKPLMTFMIQNQFPVAIDQKISVKDKRGPELIQARTAIQAQDNLKNMRADMEKSLSNIADMVEMLPHPLQASITSGDMVTWSVLDPQHMTVNVDSLALTHGKSIPGTWSAIALVDALPENDEVSSATPFAEIGESSKIVDAMNAMQELLRAQFGRPRNAYGISPIAIYRSIERNLVEQQSALPKASEAGTGCCGGR